MQKEIRTHFLKVSGKMETPDELELGSDVDVTATVYAVTDQDNQDGTVDRVFSAKLSNL